MKISLKRYSRYIDNINSDFVWSVLGPLLTITSSILYLLGMYFWVLVLINVIVLLVGIYFFTNLFLPKIEKEIYFKFSNHIERFERFFKSNVSKKTKQNFKALVVEYLKSDDPKTKRKIKNALEEVMNLAESLKAKQIKETVDDKIFNLNSSIKLDTISVDNTDDIMKDIKNFLENYRNSKYNESEPERNFLPEDSTSETN